MVCTLRRVAFCPIHDFVTAPAHDILPFLPFSSPPPLPFKCLERKRAPNFAGGIQMSGKFLSVTFYHFLESRRYKHT